jgi:hypothetical protein
MQSFKHPSNFRNDPKLRAIEKKHGEAGYSRALKIFEVVAEHGSKAGKFVPELDLNATCTNIEWLAEELRISTEELQKTLETFAAVELIDPEEWQNQIICIPQMKNHLDEYTQRKLRSEKSRLTPERLPSHPGATPDKLPSESGQTPDTVKSAGERNAATIEAQRKKDAAGAADLLLKKKAQGCWTPLKISPCGGDEFQEVWKSIWANRDESEWLSDVMRRCIEVCGQEQVDVPVPKLFLDAKQRIEQEEFDREVGPLLGDGVRR